MQKLLAKIALVATLIAPFAVPLSTQAATTWDTTGSYVIAFYDGATPYAHDMMLVQDGAGNITGTGGGYPAGGPHTYSWSIDSGTVVGNSISITAHYTSPADATSPLTVMHIVGNIANDGTMSGTWDDNYQGGSRSGMFVTTLGTAQPVLLGTLNAEDFGVVNYDTGLGILKGYTAGFGIADNTFASTTSVVVKLYAAGDVLLQTNTAILPKFNADITGTQFSSPFDVSGTFNYVTDGYWTNVREAEYGQSVPATKVVATVTLANGKVVTATNTNLTGDPTTIYPPVVVMHTLTTATAGTGSGTITSSPAGINCGVDCSESYNENTVVTLTATPTVGSTFTGWSGSCSGTGTCMVTMSAAMSATATFTLNVVPPTTPINKDQCKKDGYKNFIDPSTGKVFKNQGQCVSYTNHN